LTTVIECKELQKKYQFNTALNAISLKVQENTITGLIGRNGAGKTTLLKMIAGFWRKTSGNIQVFGEDPFDSLTVSANTIFVDDQMTFPETLTLEELLEEASKFYHHWDTVFANRLFNYFNFNKRQLHHHLSKGQQSTFNMIVGLASRSPLTIFDEPTTGMDSAVRKDFYRALLKDYLTYPRTIILSSHHLEEVEDILENIILIDRGKIFLHMPMDEVREYAIELIGEAAKVQQWAKNKKILYKESVGINDMKIVVKNEYSDEELGETGFSVSNVSANDVTVYLTNKTKGGIDDVFRNESDTNEFF